MHAEPLYAARALDAGAAGYVSKNASPDEMIAAVQRVAAGGRYIESEIAQALALQGAALGQPIGQLSAREMEIMRLLAGGAAWPRSPMRWGSATRQWPTRPAR